MDSQLVQASGAHRHAWRHHHGPLPLAIILQEQPKTLTTSTAHSYPSIACSVFLCWATTLHAYSIAETAYKFSAQPRRRLDGRPHRCGTPLGPQVHHDSHSPLSDSVFLNMLTMYTHAYPQSIKQTFHKEPTHMCPALPTYSTKEHIYHPIFLALMYCRSAVPQAIFNECRLTLVVVPWLQRP